MGISTSLQTLATVLDHLETAEPKITSLTPQDGDLLTNETLTVDATVALSASTDSNRLSDIDVTATDVTVTDNGTIAFDLTMSVAADATPVDDLADRSVGNAENEVHGVTDGGTLRTPQDHSAETEPERDTAEPDGQPQQTSEEPVEQCGSMASPEPDGQSASESETPPYKDPDRLEAVYSPEKTFEEMRDELGVDVTPQTVRNYMVDYDIHTPETTTTTASGGDADESFLGTTENADFDADEVAIELVDGYELPNDLGLSDVTDAVCTAKTLYDVQRELDVDREQTRRLLRELNLLDLVYGRLSTTSVESPSRAEIENRIRAAVLENQSDA